MKKRAQREAESAALAQRHQLGQVQRALDRVDGRVDALTEKNEEHAATLDDIQAGTSELRRQLTGMEPKWQHRTYEDEQTKQDFRQRIEPTEAELDSAVVRRWPDLSVGVGIPDASGDWKSYSREVEKYTEEHGIDVDTDPLVQLLSADRAAAIFRRFDRDYGPTPWDRWDIAAVGITGAGRTCWREVRTWLVRRNSGLGRQRRCALGNLIRDSKEPQSCGSSGDSTQCPDF